MAVLTNIARRVVGLSKAGLATEKRVGWIENELRNMRLGFGFLDDKIRDVSDQDNQNILPGTNTSKRLKNKNAVGATFLINDANCVGGEGIYFDILGLAGGDGIGLVVTPGAPLTDANGVASPIEGWMMYDDDGTPLDNAAAIDRFLADGGDLGDWEPTFSGVDVEIVHLAVEGNSSIGGEPCEAVCPPMTPELIVVEPSCAAITFAGGPLNVDCAGHVHEMYQHTLVIGDESRVESSCAATFTPIHYARLECTEEGTSEKTFTLKLHYEYLEVSAYTGTVQVVKDITTGSGGEPVVEYCCLEFVCGLLVSTDCPSGCTVSGGGY